MLRDHNWKPGYSPEDGDPLESFYRPALQDAKHYDRSTGYFKAGALTLVSRGIEALVENNGSMRVLVGCTLRENEIKAIARGEDLKQQVEKRLSVEPLNPEGPPMHDALELLAWMVANEFLQIKVVVPFDPSGYPVASVDAMYHPKRGIIQDTAGDRIAWEGSLNESEAGWQRNWEEFSVFTEWEAKPHFDKVESTFVRMWEGQLQGHGYDWRSFDIPEALKQNLLEYLPSDSQLPKRLKTTKQKNSPEQVELRRKAWAYIEVAPCMPKGGERVGEATSNVIPWPHQTHAFFRLYNRWPPRLLIADEVGLGKTIQAGMLIRQAILAKKAKRILILVPKGVEHQWQIELREKFNLNLPAFQRGSFTWCAPAYPDRRTEQRASREFWSEQDIFIMSSQLARRQDWSSALLEAPTWDLVVLDEAHHARRRPSQHEEDDRPNALLQLMRKLQARTHGLILLTATPMQVDPLEVWELLDLLGLPEEWTRLRFKRFFEETSETAPLGSMLWSNSDLFRASENWFEEIELATAQKVIGLTSLRSIEVLKALREPATPIPLNRLSSEEKQVAMKLIKSWSPIRHRISRHTRAVLRHYAEKHILDENIAERNVEDRFVHMSRDEARVYKAVESYIQTTFNRADETVRNAVGFIMTIYRRRVASSFYALNKTLERRVLALKHSQAIQDSNEEDVSDDELEDAQTTEDVEQYQRQSLVAEELAEIERIVQMANQLPVDSKLNQLLTTLEQLLGHGYDQVMVFTQYTDTMDFIREELLKRGLKKTMCYSGRGGEVPNSGNSWAELDREQAKEKFQSGEIEIFLCTEAAAEGLNFQFCGALVNYDMPWNPMRVEQRIGRIDRVGQRFENIQIVNLHYENTIETDVYRALRERINLFQHVVGPLQPILAKLPGEIKSAVLTGERKSIDDLSERIDDTRESAFDLDEIVFDVIESAPDLNTPTLDFKKLSNLLEDISLLPPNVHSNQVSNNEFHVTVGNLGTFRVTTDPRYYDAHSDNVELWSPGGTTFESVRMLVHQENSSSPS